MANKSANNLAAISARALGLLKSNAKAISADSSLYSESVPQVRGQGVSDP